MGRATKLLISDKARDSLDERVFALARPIGHHLGAGRDGTVFRSPEDLAGPTVRGWLAKVQLIFVSILLPYLVISGE